MVWRRTPSICTSYTSSIWVSFLLLSTQNLNWIMSQVILRCFHYIYQCSLQNQELIEGILTWRGVNNFYWETSWFSEWFGNGNGAAVRIKLQPHFPRSVCCKIVTTAAKCSKIKILQHLLQDFAAELQQMKQKNCSSISISQTLEQTSQPQNIRK